MTGNCCKSLFVIFPALVLGFDLMLRSDFAAHVDLWSLSDSSVNQSQSWTDQHEQQDNFSCFMLYAALCCCTDINTQATEGFQLMCSRSHGREDEDRERQPFIMKAFLWSNGCFFWMGVCVDAEGRARRFWIMIWLALLKLISSKI